MAKTMILLLVLISGWCETQSKKRPNIVLFLSDDQDVVLGGTEPMKQTKSLLGDQGVKFNRAYVTTPICCPSRASILTGRYLHNTGVKNNSVTGGCSSQEWREGLERKTFATHLHGAGYRTMYAGKYLNQYGSAEGGGVGHVPSGWDWWAGLVGNSRYYNYSLSINGKRRRHGDNYTLDYLTDVISQKALDFLDYYSNLEDQGAPFLMVLAPPACHAPFTPAPQYQGEFKDLKAPRTPAFNRDQADDPKKHWLMETQPRQMSNESMEKVDEVFRNRWRTLLSVDDMVGKVHSKLEEINLLSSTVILYTSDHGYHLGQFGLPIDKRLPYEFDIKVPFWMSGPNISANQTVTTPILSIDIAPTLLDLAGLPPSPAMDGLSILPLVQVNKTLNVETHVATNEITKNQVDNDEDTSATAVEPSIISNYVTTNEITENQVDNIEDTSATVREPSIISNYTGIKGRHSFVVEYSGEGSERSSSASCSEKLKDDLKNLSECDERFDCKCQDSKNNTYSCLRTHGQEDSLFCQFEDQNGFLEMYNILQDPYQLSNLAGILQNETLQHYLKDLGLLKNCKGEECNDV